MKVKINGEDKEIQWHEGMKFSELVQPLINDNLSNGKLLYSVIINTAKGPITVKPEHLKKLNDAKVEGDETIEFLFKDKRDYIIELSDQVLPYIDKIESEISNIINLLKEDGTNANAMKDLGNIIDGIGALGQTIVPIISLKILKLEEFEFEGKNGEASFEAIKDFVESFKAKIEGEDVSERIQAISDMLPKLLHFYKTIFQNVRK
jgi:hypothetical protein